LIVANGVVENDESFSRIQKLLHGSMIRLWPVPGHIVAQNENVRPGPARRSADLVERVRVRPYPGIEILDISSSNIAYCWRGTV